MTGDIKAFRKRFFGGFNEQDVVDYVSKLAQERNEQEDAKNKAIASARILANEVESLRSELDEEKRLLRKDYERKAIVIEAASAAFGEFEAAFTDLRAELDEAAVKTRETLMSADEAAAKFPPVLSVAKDRFEALRTALDASAGLDAADIDN